MNPMLLWWEEFLKFAGAWHCFTETINKTAEMVARFAEEIRRADEASARLAELRQHAWPPTPVLESMLRFIPRVLPRARQPRSPSWARRKHV